jgi:hypothetical protein
LSRISVSMREAKAVPWKLQKKRLSFSQVSRRGSPGAPGTFMPTVAANALRLFVLASNFIGGLPPVQPMLLS